MVIQNSKLRIQNCLWLVLLLVWGVLPAAAQGDPTPAPTVPSPANLPDYGVLVQQCGTGLQARRPDFAATGIIVTTLSRDAIWLVDLERDARYPLPDTLPCSPNCRPSPDRRDLLYVSPEMATFWLMRVDGTQRRPAFAYYVSELDWWDADHWLVWPTAGRPALYPIAGGDPQRLDDRNSFSIQPGGLHGVRLAPTEGDYPLLQLVDLETGEALDLALARPYLNGVYWSPDGSRLAYLGQGEVDPALGLAGAELFAITPGETRAVRLTDLTAAYGPVRIAGEPEARAVNWSPDGTRLAFWVMEIVGPDPAANVGQAVIHVLDTSSGQTAVYCGFGVSLPVAADDAPAQATPGLVWSPDGRYLAFGVDVPEDGRAALLIVLDTQTGDYTEISEGIYAAYGTYDPVMWGIK